MKEYSIAEERGKFMDRLGLHWVCLRPLTCEHAIVMDGRIHSCLIRSKQIKDLERGRS